MAKKGAGRSVIGFRSCPLHQCFGQPMLTLWKASLPLIVACWWSAFQADERGQDRSGKWLPAQRTEVQSDKDAPPQI